MADRKSRCPFSMQSCRDCALYRAKHYFHCHPDVHWGAVFERPEEKEEHLQWHQVLFSAPPREGLRVDEIAPFIESTDWDFWPEDRLPETPVTPREHPTHFAIDVWCGTATLLLMEGCEDDASGWVLHRTALGIPEELLAEAVLECGGQLHLAGTYPPNEKVKAWLRECLHSVGNPAD